MSEISADFDLISEFQKVASHVNRILRNSGHPLFKEASTIDEHPNTWSKDQLLFVFLTFQTNFGDLKDHIDLHCPKRACKSETDLLYVRLNDLRTGYGFMDTNAFIGVCCLVSEKAREGKSAEMGGWIHVLTQYKASLSDEECTSLPR
jgi:hypothetical protein